MGKRNDQLNPFRLMIAPDFYPIPGFSNYGISEDGRVINLATKRICKFNPNRRGYLRCSLIPDSSNEINENKFNSYLVHRLMALTFLDPGDEYSVDELQVNHKDGDTGNNHIDNLEWVTPSENVQHGVKLGRYGNNRKKLEICHYLTHEILRFYTIAECARYLHVSEDCVEHRLQFGANKVYAEGYQFRYGHNDDAWPDPINVNGTEIKYGNTRKVLVRYLLTNEVKEFDSLGDAAKALGVSLPAVSEWVNNTRSKRVQPVCPGCIQLKFAYDPTPWREVEDPYIELQENTGRAIVQVTNDRTGEKIIYTSAKECAVAHGIGVTALDWRLKSQGKKVYSDGFRYGYYPY